MLILTVLHLLYSSLINQGQQALGIYRTLCVPLCHYLFVLCNFWGVYGGESVSAPQLDCQQLEDRSLPCTCTQPYCSVNICLESEFKTEHDLSFLICKMGTTAIIPSS